jgi:hypothetical protein
MGENPNDGDADYYEAEMGDFGPEADYSGGIEQK